MIRWALRRTIDTVEQAWKDDGRHMRDISNASPSAAWLLSRVTQLLAAAALIVGFGLVAPAATQVSDQPPSAKVYTLTPKRIAASSAAVVGLIGAVIGGLALARSARRIDTMSNPAATFEPYRRRLLGLAYRMLGSMADAEDAVRETYHDHYDADLSRFADGGARAARGVRWSMAARAGCRYRRLR